MNKMICGVSESEIIDNISSKEKFKIICRIKDIDYAEIIGNLIERIKESEIEDKDAYISECEVWDEEYIRIVRELDTLFVDDALLWSREKAIDFFKNDFGDETEELLDEVWIETTDEEKEIVKIAQECKLGEIHIEVMR